MKKVIAILSVLAIMACAFATDPTAAPTADALMVTTKIGPQEPVFVLSSLETTNVTDGTATTTYSAYVAATTTPEAAAVQPTASVGETAVIKENLLIDNDQTVNFKIEQKGIARSNRVYTLIVSATDLQITTPVTTGTIATDEEFKVNLDSISLTAGTDKATDDKVVFAVDASNSKKMTATYSGRVNDAADDVVTVGTFSVKWGKNAAARVGDYKAYVTLAITTV